MYSPLLQDDRWLQEMVSKLYNAIGKLLEQAVRKAPSAAAELGLPLPLSPPLESADSKKGVEAAGREVARIRKLMQRPLLLVSPSLPCTLTPTLHTDGRHLPAHLPTCLPLT